jgi:hypothetical protein
MESKNKILLTVVCFSVVFCLILCYIMLPGVYSSRKIRVTNRKEPKLNSHEACEQYIGCLVGVKRKEEEKTSQTRFSITLLCTVES